MKLKDFQDQFQRAILAGDDTILREIPDGPRETKANLLGVYRDAYVLRLIEVVAGDHELLRAYLGEDAFNEMSRAYIAAFPSEHPSARWFSRRVPEFLTSTEPYSQQQLLGELAALEKALNDAFDAPDAAVLATADLAAIPVQDWARLSFVCHPATARLDAATNVTEIWTALKAGETPPPSSVRDEPTRIIVWRLETNAMFREMPPEEAMMWAEAGKGMPFGALCEMLATYDDPAGAAGRAAGYLKSWLDAGLLSEALIDARADTQPHCS